jgi:DNA-binding response OmpR family regulator
MEPRSTSRWATSNPLPSERPQRSGAVLSIEDSDIDYELISLSTAASECDVELERVRDFRTARSRLADEQHVPRLILCDVRLPDGDGLDLIHEIRRRPSYHDTTVVVFSTKLDDDTPRFAVAAGADEYHAKPLEPREYINTVRSIIRQHAGERALSAEPPAGE